jgi:hypothetical protein
MARISDLCFFAPTLSGESSPHTGTGTTAISSRPLRTSSCRCMECCSPPACPNSDCPVSSPLHFLLALSFEVNSLRPPLGFHCDDAESFCRLSAQATKSGFQSFQNPFSAPSNVASAMRLWFQRGSGPAVPLSGSEAHDHQFPSFRNRDRRRRAWHHQLPERKAVIGFANRNDPSEHAI